MRAVITLAIVALLLAPVPSAVLGQGRPAADGKIGADEYAKTFKHDASGMVVRWSIVGDTLYLGIQAESEGWVGVGFLADKTRSKQGADQYIFTLHDGKPAALDLYQPGPVGRPVPDEEAGGKNSILQSAVAQQGNTWTVEFARKLRTGEKTDVEIVPGKKMHLLLAVGASDDWNRAHLTTRRWDIDGFVF